MRGRGGIRECFLYLNSLCSSLRRTWSSRETCYSCSRMPLCTTALNMKCKCHILSLYNPLEVMRCCLVRLCRYYMAQEMKNDVMENIQVRRNEWMKS